MPDSFRSGHPKSPLSTVYALGELTDPASYSLGLQPNAVLEAQVFQNAVCNWRCWYCYVPFELLAGREEHSSWLSAERLIGLYSQESSRPLVIDLSGGQPDLTPEWIPWTIEALEGARLSESVYLWSDDNLSNDYYFRFLTERQRETIAKYPRYGRVGCFKGFNRESFAFNTKADPSLFERQFDIFERLLRDGLDLYAYVTFTTPYSNGIADDMARFVDRLQALDPLLPLRTVPLEIQVFSAMKSRVGVVQSTAIEYQEIARDRWLYELERRFSVEQRTLRVHAAKLRSRALSQ
jgi:uncharacterized Fe-S cluster-containing radical SAM superfamily protein